MFFQNPRTSNAETKVKRDKLTCTNSSQKNSSRSFQGHGEKPALVCTHKTLLNVATNVRPVKYCIMMLLQHAIGITPPLLLVVIGNAMLQGWAGRIPHSPALRTVGRRCNPAISRTTKKNRGHTASTTPSSQDSEVLKPDPGRRAARLRAGAGRSKKSWVHEGGQECSRGRGGQHRVPGAPVKMPRGVLTWMGAGSPGHRVTTSTNGGPGR